MTEHLEAPTPEVAAYRAARDETASALQSIRRRFIFVVGIALIFFIAGVSVFFVKVDAKFSSTQLSAANTNQIVKAIQHVQRENTSTNRCVARTTNNAVYDVILALVHKDPNPADYKALKDTC